LHSATNARARLNFAISMVDRANDRAVRTLRGARFCRVKAP
jgi:hypothetical protein